MDKNQIAREILGKYIDPTDDSVIELTGSASKVIKELLEQGDITIEDPQDLEELINSIDELDLLPKENFALKNIGNTYKEQYPNVLGKSIDKKNKKAQNEMNERELLAQKRPNITAKTPPWVIRELIAQKRPYITVINTPASVIDFRAGRETGTKGIDTTKLTKIKSMCESMISGGHFVFEHRSGLGDVATFVNLPGMPKNSIGQDRFGYYDASAELTGKSQYYRNFNYKNFGSWMELKRNDVYHGAMRGEDPKDRVDSPVKTLVQDKAKHHQVGLCSGQKMEQMLYAIGGYFSLQFPGEILSESEQIAAWAYLTGNYDGGYRLRDYTGDSRSFLRLFCGDNSDPGIGQIANRDSYFALLLSD